MWYLGLADFHYWASTANIEKRDVISSFNSNVPQANLWDIVLYKAYVFIFFLFLNLRHQRNQRLIIFFQFRRPHRTQQFDVPCSVLSVVP